MCALGQCPRGCKSIHTPGWFLRLFICPEPLVEHWLFIPEQAELLTGHPTFPPKLLFPFSRNAWAFPLLPFHYLKTKVDPCLSPSCSSNPEADLYTKLVSLFLDGLLDPSCDNPQIGRNLLSSSSSDSNVLRSGLPVFQGIAEQLALAGEQCFCFLVLFWDRVEHCSSRTDLRLEAILLPWPTECWDG